MREISVEEFKNIIETEKNNKEVDFINVCTPTEYAEKHISGVRNLPLDEIIERAKELKSKKTVYVHCRSGSRGQHAIEKLEALNVNIDLVNVQGGLLAWMKAGFDTVSSSNRTLPLMRQVMLGAGLIIISSHVAAHFANPYYIYISLFVGVSLTFSGLTGWCGMAFLLARMPWNKQE